MPDQTPDAQTLFTTIEAAPSPTTVGDSVVETFHTHPATGSAWGPMQHGGPVAALLTRAMDRVSRSPHSRITRVTVDILGAVPIADVRVSARVVRPGRRITLVEATTEARDDHGEWRPVARASAWRLATQPTEAVASRPAIQMPAPGTRPDAELAWMRLMDGRGTDGFVGQVGWDVVDEGGEGRPTQAWVDLHPRLVEGEQTTPLERAMVIADCVNGVGARLDPTHYTFLNTELTVHLFDVPRPGPVGVCAENFTGHDGIGMSTGTLHTADGCFAQVTQNVLVERR